MTAPSPPIAQSGDTSVLLSWPRWFVLATAGWVTLLTLALFGSTALINLASLGLCVWAIVVWARERPLHLLRGPVSLCVLGLLGWMLLREAWASASLGRTLWVLVEFRVLLFAVLWAPLFAWAEPRKAAAVCLLAACAVSAVLALGYLGWTGQPVSGNVFRHAPNIGGQLLVIGLLGWAVLALHWQPARKGLALLAATLALLGVAALLFASLRRTGWVVLLAAGLAFLLAQATVLSRRQLKALVVVMLLAVAAAAASPVVQQRVKMISTDLQTYRAADPSKQGSLDLSSAIRVRMWSISLALWAERPLTGTSLGEFAREYKRLDNQHGGSLVEGFNPHNEYVQMGAMFGAVGLLLYLGIYAALLRRAWQWRGSAQGTMLLVCAAAFASSVLMNSMLIDMMEGHLFALALAALAFARWQDDPAPLAQTRASAAT